VFLVEDAKSWTQIDDMTSLRSNRVMSPETALRWPFSTIKAQSCFVHHFCMRTGSQQQWLPVAQLGFFHNKRLG